MQSCAGEPFSMSEGELLREDEISISFDGVTWVVPVVGTLLKFKVNWLLLSGIIVEPDSVPYIERVSITLEVRTFFK